MFHYGVTVRRPIESLKNNPGKHCGCFDEAELAECYLDRLRTSAWSGGDCAPRGVDGSLRTRSVPNGACGHTHRDCAAGARVTAVGSVDTMSREAEAAPISGGDSQLFAGISRDEVRASRYRACLTQRVVGQSCCFSGLLGLEPTPTGVELGRRDFATLPTVSVAGLHSRCGRFDVIVADGAASVVTSPVRPEPD